MNYTKLQQQFENEVRKPIKEINPFFTVNIHTFPNMEIDFLTPSISFADEEQDKIIEYIEQIEKAYEIINSFKNKHSF
jgi:hypothetical protein